MIDDHLATHLIDTLLKHGADFADIFAESSHFQNMVLRDETIDEVTSGQEYGVGLRAFFGTQELYAFSNDTSADSLMAAAQRIVSSRQVKNDQGSVVFDHSLHKECQLRKDPWKIPHGQKAEVLFELDRLCRQESAKIMQVFAGLRERKTQVNIWNSQGLKASDHRNYILLSLIPIAAEDNTRYNGHFLAGQQSGFEFIEGLDYKQIASETTSMPLRMLDAQDVPAGRMPVVVGNGFGGVLFHEACGHPLETTAVGRGNSVFCDKINQQIAHDAVTAIDEGLSENAWGSLGIDDEGRLPQRTVLIDKGVLKSYMVDEMGSRRTGYEPTGSARRQNYRFPPTSRMRNTYIDAGPHEIDDLISSVDYGLYARKMGGGSVNPVSGEFNFNVQEGYIIKNGKIGQSVRGAALIGRGEEILPKISMVAKDLQSKAGFCGSISGTIPVCVGQPHLKIDDITVGGK